MTEGWTDKVVGSYVGGFGNMPGVHNAKVDAYRAYAKKMYPAQNVDDGFFYNYYMAAKALVWGLKADGGA